METSRETQARATNEPCWVSSSACFAYFGAFLRDGESGNMETWTYGSYQVDGNNKLDIHVSDIVGTWHAVPCVLSGIPLFAYA
jgi:hypothetical protein